MKHLKLLDWVLLIIPPFGIWHTLLKKETFLTPTQTIILLLIQALLFGLLYELIN